MEQVASGSLGLEIGPQTLSKKTHVKNHSPTVRGKGPQICLRTQVIHISNFNWAPFGGHHLGGDEVVHQQLLEGVPTVQAHSHKDRWPTRMLRVKHREPMLRH